MISRTPTYITCYYVIYENSIVKKDSSEVALQFRAAVRSVRRKASDISSIRFPVRFEEDIESRHRVILSGRRKKKAPADERRRAVASSHQSTYCAIMFRDGQYLEVIKVPRATAVNSWLSNVRARARAHSIHRPRVRIRRCICEDGTMK